MLPSCHTSHWFQISLFTSQALRGLEFSYVIDLLLSWESGQASGSSFIRLLSVSGFCPWISAAKWAQPGTAGVQSKCEDCLFSTTGFACYKPSQFVAEVVTALCLVPCCWHWGHVQCRAGYGKMLPWILQIWEKSSGTVLAFTLTPSAQHEQCAKQPGGGETLFWAYYFCFSDFQKGGGNASDSSSPPVTRWKEFLKASEGNVVREGSVRMCEVQYSKRVLCCAVLCCAGHPEK